MKIDLKSVDGGNKIDSEKDEENRPLVIILAGFTGVGKSAVGVIIIVILSLSSSLYKHSYNLYWH